MLKAHVIKQINFTIEKYFISNDKYKSDIINTNINQTKLIIRQGLMNNKR